MAQQQQVEGEYPKIVIETSGVVYEIDFSDFDGMEWHQIKQVTGGMSPVDVFLRAQMMDFDALAALIWIQRLRRESKLTFERVLRSLKLSNTKVIDEDDEDEVADGDSLDGEGEAPPSSDGGPGSDES